MHNQIEFARRIIELGNEVIKNDPTLAKKLFSQEWACNTWTAEQGEIKIDPSRNVVRLLGLLNGIAGTLPDGTSLIRAQYTPGGDIIKLEFNSKDGKQEPSRTAKT